MAIRWDWKEKMGTMTIAQRQGEETRKYKVNIYSGNCLAVFLCEWKGENGKEMYNLYSFLADAQHLRNIAKDDPKLTLFGDVRAIKLNIAYKGSLTLLKYFTKAGYKVTAYYKD